MGHLGQLSERMRWWRDKTELTLTDWDVAEWWYLRWQECCWARTNIITWVMYHTQIMGVAVSGGGVRCAFTLRTESKMETWKSSIECPSEGNVYLVARQQQRIACYVIIIMQLSRIQYWLLLAGWLVDWSCGEGRTDGCGSVFVADYGAAAFYIEAQSPLDGRFKYYFKT